MPRAPLKWMPGPGLFLLWAATRMLLLFALSRLGDAGDGVMPLIFGWAREMLAGENPYHDRGVAYPPLPMFLFALLGVGEDSAGGYARRFVASILLIDFAGLCLAFRAQSSGRKHAGPVYVLTLACVGPILLFWRYDLIPALCHLAAGTLMFLGFRRASWGALGAGIAAKPYLLVVLPMWTAWELKTSITLGRRRVMQGMILALSPSVVAAAVMLPLSGPGLVSAYSFQASRGLQVESGPAVVQALLAKAGASSQKPFFSPACLCWERAGSAAGLISAASTAVSLAGLALVVWLLWKRETTEEVLKERVMLGSCAAIVIILVTYRVFSPQYLLWALAPLSIVAGARRAAWATLLVAGAAVVAMYLYPLHYDEVVDFSGAGRWLLLARTAALVVAFFCLVPIKPKPAPFRM